MTEQLGMALDLLQARHAGRQDYEVELGEVVPGQLSEWVWCCDEVVDAMLGRNPSLGIRRDGVWTGPIRKTWGSPWSWRKMNGVPVHTWIETSDGRVVDPTRWVFEFAWPYVYVGINDHYRQEATR